MYVSDARHRVARITPDGRPSLATQVAGEWLTGSVPRLDNGVRYAMLVWARNAGGPSPGSVILPAVPGSAFLPVTGADMPRLAGGGLLAVLLGIVLFAGGTVRWNGLERRTGGVRSAP